MSMDSERLDELLDGIQDMSLRAEAREFARMSASDQMLHLYLGQRETQRSLARLEVDGAGGGWKAHVATAGSSWAGLLAVLGWLLAGQPRP